MRPGGILVLLELHEFSIRIQPDTPCLHFIKNLTTNPSNQQTVSPPSGSLYVETLQPELHGSQLNTMCQPPTTTPLPTANRLRFDCPISSTQPKTIPSVSRIEVAFSKHFAEGAAKWSRIPTYFTYSVE